MPSAPLFTALLPVWDSFEVLLFFVGGACIGVVAGILFPSLWRTFRRRFRRASSYAHPQQFSPKKVAHIKEAFVRARFCVQERQMREGVSWYLGILLSPLVSKQETLQAMYELGSTYAKLGLTQRALDSFYEILQRKPSHEEAFVYAVRLAYELPANREKPLVQRMLKTLSLYRGQKGIPLRRQVAHLLCHWGESTYQEQNVRETTFFAREALRWHRQSGRALILLWKCAYRAEIWENPEVDHKTLWAALASECVVRAQIALRSQVSPAAGADHLLNLVHKILERATVQDSFLSALPEYKKNFEGGKNSMILGGKCLETIFYAGMLEKQKNGGETSKNWEDFCQLLGQGLGTVFPTQSQVSSPACMVGYAVHKCLECGVWAPGFQWSCLHCGSEESLQPVVPAPLEPLCPLVP